MGILKTFRDCANFLIEKSYCMGQYYGEVKKIRNKDRKKLIEQVRWDNKQEKMFEKYWITNYGKKISSDWHKLYQYYTGNFRVDYFPEYLFSSKLEPLLDKNPYNDALEDKNLLHIYSINGVKTPKIKYSCCNGIYRNENFEYISKDELLIGLANIGEIVIKPTVDSGSGRGVRFVELKNSIDVLSETRVGELINIYKDKNFVIQECIKPAESLKQIYPYAINTFRIITYIWEGEIFYCPITLRLGRNGNRLDNAHAGGIFIGCNEDGYLRKYAYSEQGESFSKHPDTNIVFEGYKIDGFFKLINTCKKMHAITPQLGIISWDVTIDEDGEVTLLEINTCGGSSWFPQMANGEPLFGENTEKILKFLKSV